MGGEGLEEKEHINKNHEIHRVRVVELLHRSPTSIDLYELK